MIGKCLTALEGRFPSPYTHYISVIASQLSDCETILDIGSGPFSPVLDAAPAKSRITAFDAHFASLVESTGYDARICALMDDIGTLFRPQSFDAVVALEVIEHVERPEGWRLLRSMEAIATKCVLLSTPNGFLPQGAIHGNQYQIHRSGWGVDDFEFAGFRVSGVRGLKTLRGEESTPRLRPLRLGHYVSRMSTPLGERWPRWAFQLVATKRLADDAPPRVENDLRHRAS